MLRPSLVTRATLTAIILLTACRPALSADLEIHLVASADSAIYHEFADHYRQYLAASTGLHVSTQYLDGDLSTEPEDPAPADLTVTIGTRAAQWVMDQDPQQPVLHSMIPISNWQLLSQKHGDCLQQTALYIDQPVLRQARLAQLLFPAASDYGVLLGPTSKQREPEIAAASSGISASVVTRQIDTEPGTAPEARQLLKQSSLLIALNDPLVLNRENAKWLLYTAYQQHIPVIGFSRAYVSAGAAAAVFSEPEQMAQQAAEMTLQWQKDTHNCLPEAQFMRYFSVAVNSAVTKSLGGRDITSDALEHGIQELENAR